MLKVQGLDITDSRIQICDHLVNQRGDHRCPGISEGKDGEDWDTLFVTVYNPSIEAVDKVKITMPTSNLKVEYWSPEKNSFIAVDFAEAHCFANLVPEKEGNESECDIIIKHQILPLAVAVFKLTKYNK